MTIQSITTDVAGQIGVIPRIVKVLCDNTLAEVTAAGFLDGAPVSGYSIYPTDKVLIAYSGGNNFFDVTITDGIITLSLAESDVVLPVVTNDFANFASTSGSIKDSGYSPSNAAKTKVVMADAALVTNNLVLAADTAGTIKNAGYRILSAVTAAYGGGGTSNAFVATGLTTASIVTAVIVTSTNVVAIAKAVPTTNTLTVTFTADPGAATTVAWIATSAAVA